MIQIQNVSYSYPKGKRALSGISFQVNKGEIFGLLGPNGGGKSTLFRIISTLANLQEGEVHIAQISLKKSPQQIRKMLGIVFQSPSLDSKLTILENLICHGALYGLKLAELKKRSEELLHKFNLFDRKNERVETLSGGMKRRVEIAKAFIHRPEVLLMDEPSTGLDPSIRQEIWKMLDQMKKEYGVTVLLTTHLMDEAELCDRVAILDQGKIVALGTPHQLKSSMGNKIIEIKTHDRQKLKEMTEVIEKYSDQIDEVSLRKPSLQDVFFQLTGRSFD